MDLSLCPPPRSSRQSIQLHVDLEASIGYHGSVRGTAQQGGQPAMRSLAPILASIVFALLLMAGLLVLQLEGPPMGASVGAAIAVAALAAFLLTYDLLKREDK